MVAAQHGVAVDQPLGDPVLDALYERYAKPLEAEHYGQYIALTADGRFVLGDSLVDVMHRAKQVLGPDVTYFQLGPRAAARFGP